MANRFPYVSSGGPITQTVTQFRKAFPSVVDASLLKKLGIAPNNESYIINIIRFLGLIDDEGNKSSERSKIFLAHKDEDFQAGLGKIVHEAYKDIFEIHGDGAWSLDQDSLISFFRESDQTSDIVGKRQANTFSTLSILSGQRGTTAANKSQQASEPSKPKRQRQKATNTKSESASVVEPQNASNSMSGSSSNLALTVRIEINLPAQGDQETYDRIFKSIRENFINGRKH